jgi:sugar (pentulose or hexulose) kinase
MADQPVTDGVLLGLDVGTSAVKAGLFTPGGALLGLQRVALTTRSPRPGRSELDAEVVWDAVVGAVRALLAATPGHDVVGVGVSAACPTPLVADRSGAVLSPVCTFADARAADRVSSLAAELPPGRFEELTGNPLAVPTSSALTARELAGSVDGASDLQFGHLSSFVVHRLTGRWVMDPTHAAYTGALDISAPHEWSPEATELLEVGSLLPELLPSAAAAGRLTADAQRQLGLTSPAVVTAGCADTAAAALAVGCTEAGDAFESVGTSGVLTVCRDQPLAAHHAMNRPHVVPGRWLSHAAMSSSGASVSWLRTCLPAARPGSAGLDDLGELAAGAAPGSGGVLFLPYLAGERSPVWDPHARGAWVGMTLGTGPAELARSVFEGSAYALRQLMELESTLSGNTLRQLVSVGGGTGSRFWTSVKADVTGRVFLRAQQGDVAARGAALLAATAAGLRPDAMAAARAAEPVATSRVAPTTDAEVRAVYDQMYGSYQRLYPALQPLFPALRGPAEFAATHSTSSTCTDTATRREPSCAGPA